MQLTSAEHGPLELLILQPTPFCNINCSYCYLPNRQSTRRMSRETLEQIFRWVFASGLARDRFTLLWHAGEPLVLPVSFYADAMAALEVYSARKVPVDHSFQTNGMLIDEEWCEFIRAQDIHMGVSVDGPAFLHDRYRRTRQGKGTLNKTLCGIDLLHRYEIPFHVLTVLTADALDHPDELFDFYRSHHIQQIGFNMEEIEGPHTSSSLEAPEMIDRFRRFFARFVDLACSSDPPMFVREFDTSATALLHCRFGAETRTQENRPGAIVNVDCDGNFSTYSPELLGISSPHYGSFSLGNVFRESWHDALASKKLQLLDDDIRRGLDRCRETCRYFPFCGGGAPSNKYFENGTFASSETLFCRLHKKVCLDVALDKLERHAP